MPPNVAGRHQRWTHDWRAFSMAATYMSEGQRVEDWEEHFAAKSKRRAKQAAMHQRLKQLRTWAFPLAIAAIGVAVLLVIMLYKP